MVIFTRELSKSYQVRMQLVLFFYPVDKESMTFSILEP